MARTVEEMDEFMGSKRDEYIKFERVKEKLSRCPDLHAFRLLEKLSPLPNHAENEDMISSSEHDEIWLSVDPKIVAENATDEDLVDLVRCGVMYSEDDLAFSLFT